MLTNTEVLSRRLCIYSFKSVQIVAGSGIHDLLCSDWSEEQWLSDNFRQYLNIRGFEFTFVDG